MRINRKLKIGLLIIGATIPAFIVALGHLASLKQDQTYYDDLEEALENADHAEVLVMRNRNLKILPPEIGQLHNLKILNLGNNELTSLPREIGTLQHLEELSVENNQLDHLPIELLNLTRLRRVNFCNNQLDRFPAISNSLEEIYLSNNAITEIPVWIRSLSRLAVLDLAENRIDTISNNVILPVTVRKIDLYHNGLRSIGRPLFLLPSLKELILEENDLDEETLTLHQKFKMK
ncbi:MAG TPA: leucine-rich repeat domain-containing protein [Cyclobacteriaceae bacterium]|nr:leucine-rich repeat domain-containing protein [Cyclobacteriaceae bacterium]